jgi:hypothetical protein
MSKKVSVEINLEALQEVLGEWPGVDEVATQLGTTPKHVLNMLADGRLKGIHTRLGWLVHPACVDRILARQEERASEDTKSPKGELEALEAQVREMIGDMASEDPLERAKMLERRLRESRDERHEYERGYLKGG